MKNKSKSKRTPQTPTPLPHRFFWAINEYFDGPRTNVQCVKFTRKTANLVEALKFAAGADGIEVELLEEPESITTRRRGAVRQWSHPDGFYMVAWNRAELAEAYLDIQLDITEQDDETAKSKGE